MASKKDHRLVHYFSVFEKDVAEKCFRGVILHGDDACTKLVLSDEVEIEATQIAAVSRFLDDLVVAEKMLCTICEIAFSCREDQVLHYKLGWHCHNLKRKLYGKDPVDEPTYAQSTKRDHRRANEVEENTESDSGLSSDSSNESSPVHDIPLQNSRVFFKNKDGCLFSVHKCILWGKKETVGEGQNLITRIEALPTSFNWAVVMLGGGHFAAAVFKGRDIVVHKTFHRYVTRAKQGSSQSAHDSSRHATSGGASLRRYNESALKDDVQTLLNSWSDVLEECTHIFFRAPSHNQQSLFAGKRPPFSKNDPRLRTIPFPTKRPTFQEVVQVHRKLSSVECHGMAIENLAKTVASVESSDTLPVQLGSQATDHDVAINSETVVTKDYSENLKRATDVSKSTKKRAKPKRDKPVAEAAIVNTASNTRLKSVKATTSETQSGQPKHKTGKDDDDTQKLHSQLYTACKVGNLKAMQLILDVPDTDALQRKIRKDLVNRPFGRTNSMLLHVAAKAGHAEIVRHLLQSGADPSLRDSRGNPPYKTTNNRETQNMFRRFMAQYPNKYNYKKAQIPGPLTEEDEKAEAERVRQEKEVCLRKEQEAKERAVFLKLTDAEKKSLTASRSGELRCWQCGLSLEKKIPFEYCEFKFCSVGCVKEHRASN